MKPPYEITKRQDEYYKALEISYKDEKSTKFIEYILEAINQSLDEFLKLQNNLNTSRERVNYFIEFFKGESFSRKEYMQILKIFQPQQQAEI